MKPAKPLTPQTANSADQQDLTKIDINDPTVNPVLKMQAMAAKAKNPGAFAKAQGQTQQGTAGGAGMKGFGEKPFSVITKDDPNGEVHVYAKNVQDAKQKYQKLGNPLGSVLDAEEVAEGRGGIDDEANLFYIYKDGRVKQRMVDNRDERTARAQGYRDSIEQALRVHNIIRSKYDANKWIQKQGDKWVQVHPFGQQGVAEGLEDKVVFQGHTIGHIETDSDGDPVGIVYSNNPQSKRPFEIYGYEDVNHLKQEMISQWNKRVPKGAAEGQTDYQKRRQRERDIDAGKPVKPLPKNPQNDYFARRKKEKQVAEGFWDNLADAGYSKLGFKPDKKARKLDLDREENSPFSNYRKSWVTHNKKFGMGADERKQSDSGNTSYAKSEPVKDTEPKKNNRGQLPFHIVTVKDRKGDTVIMAKDAKEAEAMWKRKYSMTGDKLIKVMTAREANMDESMTTTTLKTTFEGLEEQIASLLEEFGLENGRDFYIDGTIRTVNEQTAQDILSVLADHDLPGQATMRTLGEQYAISLIGQGEELVENLTVGSDFIEIKHIGEGVVRVYVNSDLAEQFDTGTAAFKYVKTLQQNLAEAEQELVSAMSAEAGEDLMKISNITEGWEDMLKHVKDSSGPKPNGGAGIKKGKRYGGADQNDDEKEEAPKDADGNPVKRGRGRPKKVRESLASIQAMRKQVAEALARVESLPEAQRNSPQVQAMVDRLSESVRTAIAKTK
jgi:hypothetical protein